MTGSPLAATHGSVADVFINGYVVSQYLKDYSFTGARDKAEVSAFKSTNKSYVMGLYSASASLTGLYDGTNTSAIDALMYQALTAQTGQANDQQWLYAPEGAQGAGAFGFPAVAFSGTQGKYDVKSALTAATEVSASMDSDAGGGGIDHGVVHQAWATQGSSGSSGSVNNGASSANGGVLIVHALNDTASLVVSLYDSADNSTFAAVSGYSITCTNTTQKAYRYPAAGTTPTGTIRQYTQIRWTGTGTFLGFFSRK